MNWIRRTCIELAGLFVEDGSFALAIGLWVLAGIFLLPRFLPAGWKGPAFFAGVLGILLENVHRTARRSEKP